MAVKLKDDCAIVEFKGRRRTLQLPKVKLREGQKLLLYQPTGSYITSEINGEVLGNKEIVVGFGTYKDGKIVASDIRGRPLRIRYIKNSNTVEGDSSQQISRGMIIMKHSGKKVSRPVKIRLIND